MVATVSRIFNQSTSQTSLIEAWNRESNEMTDLSDIKQTQPYLHYLEVQHIVRGPNQYTTNLRFMSKSGSLQRLK